MVEATVKREPICWLRLPGCTVRSQTADHYHPRKTHPHLADEMSNLRGACHRCNWARRATPFHQLGALRERMLIEQQATRRSATLGSGRRSPSAKQPKALGFFRSP